MTKANPFKRHCSHCGWAVWISTDEAPIPEHSVRRVRLGTGGRPSNYVSQAPADRVCPGTGAGSLPLPRPEVKRMIVRRTGWQVAA